MSVQTSEEVRLDGATTVFLLPEEITVIEAVHGLRDRQDPDYMKGIEAFGVQLAAEGQIQNLTVAEVPVDGGVEYQLIAGGRRRDAIASYNAGLKAGAEAVKLRCTVLTGVDAVGMVRKALKENIERENFTPIDLARDIASVKKLINATGKDWSKQVADFMGVSRAQVTQHYKLLSLPGEALETIKREGWSSQAAQDLLDVKPEKVTAVVKAASEAGKADKKKKDAAKPVNAQTAAKPASTPAESESDKGSEKGNVKRKHVVAAARAADAFEKPKAIAKSEIVDFFDSCDGPAYGHENSPVRQFVQYFRDKYVPGIGSDKTLLKKFDAMVLNAKNEPFAGAGTPGKEAKEEPVAKGKAAGAKGK